MPKRKAILEIYQLVLALFLFVSPWLFAFAHGALRVDTLVGAAIAAVISCVALFAFREWEEWLICVLGLWIAASPWVLGFQRTAGMVVNMAVGLLIAYLALLAGSQTTARPIMNDGRRNNCTSSG